MSNDNLSAPQGRLSEWGGVMVLHDRQDALAASSVGGKRVRAKVFSDYPLDLGRFKHG